MLKIEYVDVAKLKPYDKNTRKHEDYDVSQIAKSIEQYGFNDPIGIWGKDNIIVEGHGRLLAAKKLGMDKVPCIRLDNLTDEQRREYAIMHNKTAELSAWDFDLLAAEIDGLDFSGFDIDWGLPADEEETEITEDEPPEVDEENEPICKLGDIWQLGRHKLICGDSTDRATVERLMDGKKADMVFTDPPYGVSYTGGVIHGNTINKSHKREMLKNDEIDIYCKFIPVLCNVIDDGAIYIFYATRNTLELFLPLKENGIEVNSIIVWNKINTGYADMNSNYKNKYEPCVYAHKKGHKLNFVGATNECTVWDIEKDRVNNLHPTQKPVALPARAIKNSSIKDNIVLDLFGGSGSTLIACEQLDRVCYMAEIDEHYCDVIIKRWENLTGKKAVKIS